MMITALVYSFAASLYVLADQWGEKRPYCVIVKKKRQQNAQHKMGVNVSLSMCVCVGGEVCHHTFIFHFCLCVFTLLIMSKF